MAALDGDFSAERTTEGLHLVFEDYAVEPPGGDRVFAAMAHDLLEIWQEEPIVNRRFESIINARRQFSDYFFANLCLRAIQHDLLMNKVSGYPSEFKEPGSFSEMLPDLFMPANGGRSFLHSYFLMTMLTRTIQSNVSERYKIVPHIINTFPESFRATDDLTMLDFGCSENHGARRIGLNVALPFSTVKAGVGDEELPGLTDVVNDTIKARFRYRYMLGIDAWPNNVPENKMWIKSCSLRPEELEDRQRVRQYNMLEADEDDKKVKFVCTQMDTSPESLPTFLDGEKFDLVTALTALYQNTVEQRRKIVEVLMNHLKPGGLLIIQDGIHEIETIEQFTSVENLSMSEAAFNEPGGYGVVIGDQLLGPESLMAYAKWDSGRCNEISFTNTELAQRAVRTLLSR